MSIVCELNNMAAPDFGAGHDNARYPKRQRKQVTYFNSDSESDGGEESDDDVGPQVKVRFSINPRQCYCKCHVTTTFCFSLLPLI